VPAPWLLSPGPKPLQPGYVRDLSNEEVYGPFWNPWVDRRHEDLLEKFAPGDVIPCGFFIV